AGERLPRVDFHHSDQIHSKTHWPGQLVVRVAQRQEEAEQLCLPCPSHAIAERAGHAGFLLCQATSARALLNAINQTSVNLNKPNVCHSERANRRVKNLGAPWFSPAVAKR